VTSQDRYKIVVEFERNNFTNHYIQRYGKGLKTMNETLVFLHERLEPYKQSFSRIRFLIYKGREYREEFVSAWIVDGGNIPDEEIDYIFRPCEIKYCKKVRRRIDSFKCEFCNKCKPVILPIKVKCKIYNRIVNIDKCKTCKFYGKACKIHGIMN